MIPTCVPRPRSGLATLRARVRSRASWLVLVAAVALAPAALGATATPTLAAWTDEASVSGATLGAGTLAAPTGLSVSQTCVEDPTPVRRTGTTTGTGTGSVTINKPATAVAGDVLIAGIVWNGDHNTFQPTAPAGWTLITGAGNNNIGGFSYYRVVQASEPSSYSWTGRATPAAGGITAYGGVDTVNPINASGARTDTVVGTAIAPSITTTRANTVLVGLFGAAAGGTVNGPPAMSALWTASAGTGGSVVTGLAEDESRPTTGSTGTRQATTNGSQSAGNLVAVQPPAYPFATTTWTPSSSAWATGQTFTRSSGATVQRTATLVPADASETDGPLASGTSYTTSVTATFQNWVSSTSSTSFTGRSCWPMP